jgi:hypothetical protein
MDGREPCKSAKRPEACASVQTSAARSPGEALWAGLGRREGLVTAHLLSRGRGQTPRLQGGGGGDEGAGLKCQSARGRCKSAKLETEEPAGDPLARGHGDNFAGCGCRVEGWGDAWAQMAKARECGQTARDGCTGIHGAEMLSSALPCPQTKPQSAIPQPWPWCSP